jgi:hypothetical protein
MGHVGSRTRARATGSASALTRFNPLVTVAEIDYRIKPDLAFLRLRRGGCHPEVER